MEANRETRQVVAEFHPYSRLPTELKLMIWGYYFEEFFPGAHRFRLLVNSKYPTRIIVRPDRDQKEDASLWRERRIIARIDKFSFDRLLQFERNAKLLYQNPQNNRTVRVEENHVKAMVDGRADLVTFRFNYGTSLASLTELDLNVNRDIFAGITQIGIEHDFYIKGYRSTAKYLPFACPCVPPHHPSEVCEAGIVSFLRFFKNLKTLYLIYPVTKQNLKSNFRTSTFSPMKLQPLCKAAGGMTQTSLNVFRRIQDIAEKVGLKQYHDRIGMYCEVCEETAGEIFFWDVWFAADEIRQAWDRYHIREQTPAEEWRNTEFKVLAWADLRGVAVFGADRPLRYFGPWD